jgi:hypothetical protein
MPKKEDVLLKIGVLEFRQNEQGKNLDKLNDIFKTNNETINKIITTQQRQEKDIDGIRKAVNQNKKLIDALDSDYKLKKSEDNIKKIYFDKWRKYLYIIGVFCFSVGVFADESFKMELIQKLWSKI